MSQLSVKGARPHAARTCALWCARLAVGLVFAWNVQCALAFVLTPRAYMSGFELSGTSGEAAVRALGILFLMWNATYPPVIVRPQSNRVLFVVVLVQQAVGLLGEVWLRSLLPSGHAALSGTITRFVIFDAVGLVLMACAYVALMLTRDSAPPETS